MEGGAERGQGVRERGGGDGGGGRAEGGGSRALVAFGLPRIPWHGVPKLYATYLDESLNRCLRSIAAFCHRRTFASRVHRLIDMVGRLVSPEYFYSGRPWLELISGPFC